MTTALMHIELRHQYYDDGIWHQLSLKPDEHCQSFIQKYRLMLLNTEFGISLYYYGSGPVSGFIARLDELLEGKPLRFLLHNDDPYYANISNLPVDWAGQLNYSSQATTIKKDSKTQVLNLQLAQRTLCQSGVIGQLEIEPQSIQVSEHTHDAPTFAIEMAARQTHWYYYVCNRTQRSYDQLSVNNNDGFIFEQPKDVTLPTGEAALLFSSGKQTFAMKQSIEQPFNLVQLQQGADAHSAVNGLNSHALIQGLPAPRTDQLHIEQQNGQRFVYSPMYVYI